MRSLVLFLVALAFWPGAIGSSGQKSHPVTTFINAKWNVTPVALEIAEFLADESPNLYWKFIEELNNLKTPIDKLEPASKQYKTAIKLASKLLGAAQVNLLKLSLSMHSLSPRIQAHQQIAKELLHEQPCDNNAFVVIKDTVVCNFKDFEKEFKKAKKHSGELFNFDQIYPGSELNDIPVFLYSQIGTTGSRKRHEVLSAKALSGEIKYINRHYIKNESNEKVRLSGYGVELHLKSTEYKSQDDSPRSPGEDNGESGENVESEVNGFDFKVLKNRFPNLETSLDRFRKNLLEKTADIAPLKAWEFQELGLQAAYQIVETQNDESLRTLQHIAQNFPTQAKTLLNVRVDDAFKTEMKYNVEAFGRNLNLQPPDAGLFVNGLFFDGETLDTETLLDSLKTELRSLTSLHRIGIPSAIAKPLLGLDLSSVAKEFAIDIRDSAILWINDIENDAAYKRWPSSVLELLRPSFPGMLKSIRKNLFNLVLILDPITPPARQIIKLAESFVLHSAPVRLGLVMDFRNQTKDTKQVYQAMLCAFNYVSQTKSPKDALGFLTDIYSSVKPELDVTVDQIKTNLKKYKLSDSQVEDILGEDSDYEYGRQLAEEFVDRLGNSTSPVALLNGVPLTDSAITDDDFEEAVLTEIMQQTPALQKAVYKGDLTDSDDTVEYLMKQPHVMPRLHPTILSTTDAQYLDLTGVEFKDLENVNALATLSNSDMTATLIPNVGYFYTKNSFQKIAGAQLHFVTIWVAADLETKQGKQLLINALEFMKTTQGARVAFIPNTESSKPPKDNLNSLVWAASHSLDGPEATEFAWKVLQKEKYEMDKKTKDLLSSTLLHMKMLRVYCQRVLKFKNQESGVILNGRILGPLKAKEQYSLDDFGLMDRFINYQYGEKILTALKESEEGTTITSDTIMKLIAVLVPRQNTKSRFVLPSDLKEEETVLKLAPHKPDEPFFDIVAVLDPASKGAQKLAPLLILLRNVINCNMKVFLCAVDKHSDLPVKNFYRFVVSPELEFTGEGKATNGPIAKFTGLPVSSLLTQTLQIPDNWMVEIVNSVYDLDNIKLIEINGPVHSSYELEYLLLEGHCFDANSGSPPRGLQFTLGTKMHPIVVDTIVMANLGYFQLKANPGAWILKLRQGKSSDIYDITSVDGLNVLKQDEETKVVISSLKSNVIKVKVAKKPDQLSADLLSDDQNSSSGIWDSIKNSFPGGEEEGDVINIFSVASGHLYERLLRIMMLSTIKKTTSKVKFWFLKNYLSPQFIDFLPQMAEEYNFQYELVQYKWPRWLHQQTEKQRIIWGYKILFLDVLFPLDVKKIIFVDADAIVRADLKELNNLDLDGAPYAYTPFCDSRKEMEGFRFWKQGYWRNHLQGRKYHISALYVVDLKRFRRIAAGDRLRGQYQALSQDPNSLSNLDQDLPNNMIYQVAIKSLPQDWLYCDTWCSRDGLKNAKVIDLCNNPQTKEAKLTAAQRIVPEWIDYDTEIKNLMTRVEAELHGEAHDQTTEEKRANEKDEL